MITFLSRALNISAVFLLGSTGETITEKVGHLNLGTPGIMCFGAVGACVGEYLYVSGLGKGATPNAFLAILIPLLFTVLFAGLLGLVYSFFTVTLRCNQNVTGLTITTFGIGLTNYIIAPIVGEINQQSLFKTVSKFFTAYLPFADNLGWFGEIFLKHGFMVYLAIAVAVVTSLVFNRTRVGLNLRAVGENPATADAAGINVTRYKYVATIIGSAISGLGGLFFVMDNNGGAWEYVIDVFGWLCVALVIFSVWRPNLGIIGAIVFGGLYIAPSYIVFGGVQLEQNVVTGLKQLVKMLPYVVTIVVLIITSIIGKKETQPPQALGQAYFREER